MPSRMISMPRTGLVVVIVMLALTLIPLHAAPAATCGVPDDYNTIQDAVNAPTCDTIILRNITFNENVSINRNVTINGSNGSTVSGTGGGPVFAVGTLTPTIGVTLRNLVITNGQNPGYGGGIENAGGLILVSVTITGNQADLGGGIHNRGALTMYSSTVSANHALESGFGCGTGGGIFEFGGQLSLQNSTVSGNEADCNGGGIVTGYGDSTYLYYSTIANNIANANLKHNGAVGGGIANTGNPGTTVSLESTILDANQIDQSCPNLCLVNWSDCNGTFNSMDYNLISHTTNCTISSPGRHDIYDKFAGLGPLAYNGGPTPTHALLPGSPALDQIPNGSTNPMCLASFTDQRGFPRPAIGGIGLACDIGAFEFQPLRRYLPLISR